MKRGYRILLSLHPGAPARLVEQALEALWPGMADELVGLFIEDSEVLELARLPVAREIRHDSATPRAPDAATLEREFRAQAERLRRIFEARAQRLARRCAFRVARSSPAVVLREAGGQFDVLLLADSPERLEYHWTVRRQLRMLASEGPRIVMIARPTSRFARRVAVLWDGTPAARRALKTATEIADSRGMELLLLLLPGAPGSSDAEQVLAGSGGRIAAWTARQLPESNPGAIAGALQASGAAFAVIPRSTAAKQPEFIAELVEQAPCSIILAG